jgi:hypothetical protein
MMKLAGDFRNLSQEARSVTVIRCDGVDWTEVAQDPTNKSMKLRVQKEKKNSW